MAELAKQTNYEVALQGAWDCVRRKPVEEFHPLGVSEPLAGSRQWFLPVLDTEFEIDVQERCMTAIGYGEVGCIWQILALHALLVQTPFPESSRQITFEEIPEARGYSAPYRGRVLEGFTRTVGHSRESLLAAAQTCGGQVVPGGDLAVRFQVFPHVPLTIVWYRGDDEFTPGASFLYNDNITSVFEVEDIVVMTEQVVARLRGKPW